MAIKAACALLAAPLGTALGAAAPGRLGVLLAVGAPVAGFLAPDYYLARRTRERIRATRRDLPALLDLLRVAVDAGLAPSQALGAVGERSDSPLAREWAAAAAQVRLGIPLGEALEALRAACPRPS